MPDTEHRLVAGPRRVRFLPAPRTLALLVGAAVLAPILASCGGGTTTTGRTGVSTAPTTTRPTPTTTRRTAPTTTAAAGAGGHASVSTGPVRGALHANDHAPKVNRLWPYTVTVTDAAGRPLSGTVEIEFVFMGAVVGRDTPPSHPVTNGHWQDKLTFPKDSVGVPLTFRAVVHTRLGSITLDWPITVRG